jgi:glycosyltransferase involved in cell wall biosynthesis
LQEKVGGFYIGNGVNTLIFHPQHAFKDKDPDSLLYFHRGIPWKGDELALATLRELYNLKPGVKVHIVIRKGTQIRVGFPFTQHSNLTDMELAELYSRIRVMLYTSSFEGFGLPPIEAFACGTNVVSTNFLGNEFLVDGKNCYLANSADLLARCVLKLLDSDYISQMQLAYARKTAMEHDFDFVVERMLKAFGSL